MRNSHEHLGSKFWNKLGDKLNNVNNDIIDMIWYDMS